MQHYIFPTLAFLIWINIISPRFNAHKNSNLIQVQLKFENQIFRVLQPPSLVKRRWTWRTESKAMRVDSECVERELLDNLKAAVDRINACSQMPHELSLTTRDECYHERVSAWGGTCSSVVSAPDEADEVIETLFALLTCLCISKTAPLGRAWALQRIEQRTFPRVIERNEWTLPTAGHDVNYNFCQRLTHFVRLVTAEATYYFSADSWVDWWPSPWATNDLVVLHLYASRLIFGWLL